jgi:hypothetical protein
MAQGIDSTKTAALPSNEELEVGSEDVTEAGKSEQHKMDHLAMEMAKRGEKRFAANEETTPADSLFTK